MKKLVLPAALLFAATMLPATGQCADAEAGKALFAKKCASCHGKGGEGNAAMAKMLKAEIKDLGSADVQGKSDADLSGAITAGVGKMKAVAGVSADDAANIVAFIRTLKK